MKLQPAVKKETAHIALGTAAGVAVMFAVFAALGRFDYTVALGGVLGGAVAVANFLLLGLTVPACVRFAVQFAALFAVELAAARTGYAVWLAARQPWFQAALSYVWAAALVLWGNIGGGSFMYFRF